ncbi:MAG: helix-turn-helix transcriptional regulator [Planctomycetes bacterium]|nr:helix-turn-helix transcriptional regulator [Planctomycetota bacterium]
MNTAFQITINILIPCASGMLFLLYGVVFHLLKSKAEPNAAATSSRFSLCLVCLSLALISRPLQMLLGPHPLPLILVCIRMSLFNALVAPLLFWVSYEMSLGELPRKTRNAIFSLGLLSSLLYSAAMIVGTDHSIIAYHFGAWPAYDSYTPTLTPPWYAREWSQLGQGLGMTILGGAGAWIALRTATQKNAATHLKTQLRAYGIGIGLFTLSFTIGTISKEWWLYYLVSAPSALIMGQALLARILELKRRSQMLTPLVRDELLSQLSGSSFNSQRAQELLDLSNHNFHPTVAWVLQSGQENTPVQEQLSERTELEAKITSATKKLINPTPSILLPMGSGCFTLLLEYSNKDPNRKTQAHEFLETIQQNSKTDIYLGIGSITKFEDIQRSYLEAAHAAKAALTQKVYLLNYDDLRKQTGPPSYPTKEREEMMNALKSGNYASARIQLTILLERLTIGRAIGEARARCTELVSSIALQSLQSSSKPDQLMEQSEMSITLLQGLKEPGRLQQAVLDFLNACTPNELNNEEVDSYILIHKARSFIEEHYAEPIGREDVARHVHLSVSHLTRLFRECGSETIQRCIAKARITKAAELLKHSELSITKIAYDVGFKDSNYFSTVFSKEMKQSPKQYRNELRK